MKQVKFVIDYGMISHGLAPLFVDGHAEFVKYPSDKLWPLSEKSKLAGAYS